MQHQALGRASAHTCIMSFFLLSGSLHGEACAERADASRVRGMRTLSLMLCHPSLSIRIVTWSSRESWCSWCSRESCLWSQSVVLMSAVIQLVSFGSWVNGCCGVMVGCRSGSCPRKKVNKSSWQGPASIGLLMPVCVNSQRQPLGYDLFNFVCPRPWLDKRLQIPWSDFPL